MRPTCAFSIMFWAMGGVGRMAGEAEGVRGIGPWGEWGSGGRRGDGWARGGRLQQ